MKYLQFTLICLFGIFLYGCSDAFAPEPVIEYDNAQIVGDKIVLTAAFDVSEFRECSTRAFADVRSLEDLKLYIVEFVDNGSPLINTLNAVYRPTENSVHVEGNVVKYKVELNRTDQPRILHFLAVDNDDLKIPNGVESSVMPGLTSENEQDAYWRRLEFKEGYCVHETYGENKDRWAFNQDFKDKLLGDEVSGPKNLKLVRNFAKITVGMAEGAITPIESGMTFKLEDFIIVNTPLKGSMVPYSTTGSTFPEFLDKDGNPLPYEDVAKTYSGFSPPNTTLGNQVTSQDAPVMGNQDLIEMTDGEKIWMCLPSKFMYERPFSSMSRTYIIIKGKYYNSVTNPDAASSTYYKLDLGKNDGNGIFRYFGLLRNYHYFIRITGVATAGYSSAQAAAEGTVYNNISFDVDTDNLINLSNGKDLIRVSTTTAVITEDNYTFEFKYAYKEGILSSNNGTYNNDLATVIGLEAGDVIEDVAKIGDETDANGVLWRTYRIKCKNPTAVTKVQEFTVVREDTGLGRTISLVSHLKWDLENLCQFAGIWENYPDTYNGLFRDDDGNKGTEITGLQNSTYANICGTNMGSQFTIFFDIPDNIPEVLFPLEFIIESEQQGLENEPMGTIVVSPGPSLFSGTNDNRIQYRKSVTWTEYNSVLRMDVRDDNGTVIGNPEDGPVIHRIRCRFRTIETLANGTHIRVRIANDNFNWGGSEALASKCTVRFDRLNSANGLAGPGLVYQNPEN